LDDALEIGGGMNPKLDIKSQGELTLVDWVWTYLEKFHD
jgi:hypothetical protein